MVLFLLFLYACVGLGVGTSISSIQGKYGLPDDLHVYVAVLWPVLLGIWLVLHLENTETKE